MGQSVVVRIGIFFLLSFGITLPFTPSVRVTKVWSIKERLWSYQEGMQATHSSIFAADHEKELASTNASEPKDDEETRLPTIKELRRTIRKCANTVPQSEGLTEATQALQTMFQHYSNNDKHDDSTERRPKIDVIDCTQVINAWSKSRRSDAPQQALDILKAMVESYETTGMDCIRPDGVTYNSVMNSFARRGDLDGASAVFAMQVRDFKEGSNEKAKPDAYTFSTMINACSRSSRTGVSETAEKLLATMNDWHFNGDLEGGPSVVTYNSVINCFRKSNAPQKARKVLEDMLSKKDSGDNTVRPNRITYNSVLNAHARQGDVQGATEVFALMKEDLDGGNDAARPDVKTYNILIDAWSKSNRPDAPEQAESLLREIVQLHSVGSLEEGPDIITYGAVINCYSKSNLPNASSMARQVLKTMVSEYENGNDGVRPDTVTYAAVMNAHARRGDTKGTQEVFEMMRTDYQEGNEMAKPNIQNYNILIDSWSKSNKEEAPKQAERILEEVSQLHANGLLRDGPDAVTYGAAINCYSKSNLAHAPTRAREILQTMISEYETNARPNVRPNTITYAAVMDAHARQGDVRGATHVFEMLQRDTKLEPNVHTYTILIDAWSKSNSEDASLKAAMLLSEMVLGDPLSTAVDAISILDTVIARYDDWNEAIRPDTFTYNAIMNAFAKQGNVDGAVKIFDLMSKDEHSRAKVDIRTYNILLDAWAKSKKDCAAERSEELLEEMEEKYRSGEWTEKPDAVTYRTLIQCLELFEDTEDRVEELKLRLAALSKGGT